MFSIIIHHSLGPLGGEAHQDVPLEPVLELIQVALGHELADEWEIWAEFIKSLGNVYK